MWFLGWWYFEVVGESGFLLLIYCRSRLVRFGGWVFFLYLVFVAYKVFGFCLVGRG